MPRKLRKGRERCGATRRDGQPCEAPAIAGGLVCRIHGGSAPQVAIRARHHQLQLAYFVTERDWMDARGTGREDDALTRHGRAGSELRAYESKLDHLRELQAEVRQRRQDGSHVRPAELPAIVRLAKLEHRAAELARWKPRAGDPWPVGRPPGL